MSLLELLNWVGMPARFAHLAAGVVLVGTAALLLLAGRSVAPAAGAWQARMLRWSRWLVLAAIAGGLGTLIHQVAVLEAEAGAILDPSALGRFLFQTQAGIEQLGPRVEPERMVLVVLYTLPESRPRLKELAFGGDSLELQDLEIIFAPTDADPDAIRRLGPESRLLFPIATRGAEDIVQTYQMFEVLNCSGSARAISTGAGRPSV